MMSINMYKLKSHDNFVQPETSREFLSFSFSFAQADCALIIVSSASTVYKINFEEIQKQILLSYVLGLRQLIVGVSKIRYLVIKQKLSRYIRSIGFEGNVSFVMICDANERKMPRLFGGGRNGDRKCLIRALNAIRFIPW